MNKLLVANRKLNMMSCIAEPSSNGNPGEDEDEVSQLTLAGYSMVVKDNIDVAGMPTTAGTPALHNCVPDTSATAVTRLEAAGATIAGKARMHELAYGITSNNSHGGPVRNPYDVSRIAGGSSGGTAAAIASGAVIAGLGTDTGGSSRIPAALCGICGFRPTTGRYPADGVLRVSRTRDTIGPMAQSIEVIRKLDQVLADVLIDAASIDLAELRFGVARDSFLADLDPEVHEAMESTIKRLQSRGVSIIEVEGASCFELNEKVSFPVVLFETPRDVAAYLKSQAPQLSLHELIASIASHDVAAVIQQATGGDAIPEAMYQEALHVHRPQLQTSFARLFAVDQLDAFIYPTTPLTARPIGEDETVTLNGRQVPTFPTYIRNCDPSANAGIPSVTLPMGLSTDGLPIGLSLDGPVGCDSRLLALAESVEQVLEPIPKPRENVG